MLNCKRISNWPAGAFGLLLALGLLLLNPLPVFAVPQMSHVFYGTVTMAGSTAPEGTTVTATVAGLEYSTTVDNMGRYGWDPLFKITADDPATVEVEGASDEDSIEFKIGGVVAELFDVAAGEILDSYPFAIGGYTELNLSTEEASPESPVLVADAGGPYSDLTGASIILVGSASGGTAPYTYAWDLDDDGQYDDGTGISVSHSWNDAGSYTVGLQVTDSTLTVDIDTCTINVTVVTTTLFAEAGGPYIGNIGASITITGSASGGTTPYTFSWDLDNDGQYDDASTATTSYSWSSAGIYTIGLQITDNTADTSTDTATVTITTSGDSGGGGGGFGGGGSPDTIYVGDIVTNSGKFMQTVVTKSSDSLVKLTIEKDVIGKNRGGGNLTSIKISPMTTPPTPPSQSNIIGLTYDLSPSGVTFTPSITVEFTYNPTSLLTGVSEENLVLAFYDTNTHSWVQLEDIVVDPVHHTVSGKTSHFTAFAVIAYISPAVFTASNLAITPTVVGIGETSIVTVTVSNTGDISGKYDVALKTNNTIVETKSVTVAGKKSTDVTFAISQQTAGVYTVSINGLSGVLTVEAPTTESTPSNVVTATPKPTESTQSTPSKVTPPASTISESTTPTSTMTPKNNGKNWLLVGGIACGIIIVGLTIALVARRRH